MTGTGQTGAPDKQITNNVHGCALVFEGGGYRGAYTAGMVNLLLEQGIYFDYACGISAGASHTINYVSRDQTRVHMAFLAIDGDEPVGGMGSFLRGRGYFNADYLYEGCIRDGFCGFAWETFVANPARIRIQAFEASTGRSVSFTKDDMPDVWQMINRVRASSTIPIAMKPLPLDGKTYYDGGLGVGAGLPLHLAEQDGYERFVMLATRPAGYHKKPVSSVERAVFGRLLGGMPHVLEATLTRPERYNAELDRIARLEREGRALVIRPREMPVSNGTLDTTRLQRAYAMGHDQLREELDRLTEFVGL
ncbi:MAG: patatin family protein [Atopobiaceae bacterium]|nr:patatin family protein [Atopobiaceae bacterium]